MGFWVIVFGVFLFGTGQAFIIAIREDFKGGREPHFATENLPSLPAALLVVKLLLIIKHVLIIIRELVLPLIDLLHSNE